MDIFNSKLIEYLNEKKYILFVNKNSVCGYKQFSIFDLNVKSIFYTDNDFFYIKWLTKIDKKPIIIRKQITNEFCDSYLKYDFFIENIINDMKKCLINIKYNIK